VASPDPGQELLARLKEHGFDFFSGVPCSLTAALHAALEGASDTLYVEAVREDEAVAHAAGAFLAGRKPVVLMQNSGLGNSLNAILSLSQIYGQPFLLIITWRGFEGRDAPEHLYMGEAMTPILDASRMPWQVYDPERTDEQLDAIDRHFTAARPAALIVRPGLLERAHE